MTERAHKLSIWNPRIVGHAAVDSVRKLDPRIQVKNPVMVIVEVGSLLTTMLYAMKDRGDKRGLATLCIGGGEALAVVLER